LGFFFLLSCTTQTNPDQICSNRLVSAQHSAFMPKQIWESESQDTGARETSVTSAVPSPGGVVPAPQADSGTQPPSPLLGFALHLASFARRNSWLCSAAGCSPTCFPALLRRPAARQEQDDCSGQGAPRFLRSVGADVPRSEGKALLPGFQPPEELDWPPAARRPSETRGGRHLTASMEGQTDSRKFC